LESDRSLLRSCLNIRESRRSVTIPRFLVEELAAHMATYMRPATEDRQGRT
jgi:hypothetical protein